MVLRDSLCGISDSGQTVFRVEAITSSSDTKFDDHDEDSAHAAAGKSVSRLP